MTQYLLQFPRCIIDMEQKGQWQEATDFLYEEWKKDPRNLNLLICSGAEIWYALYLKSVFDSAPNGDSFAVNKSLLERRLVEVARYGFEIFSENPVFCGYFGYMIKVIPFIFHTDEKPYILAKDSLARQISAIQMMRKAFVLEPNNPFTKVMFYEIDGGEEYIDACCELWKHTPVSRWGDSEVSQYFLRILNG